MFEGIFSDQPSNTRNQLLICSSSLNKNWHMNPPNTHDCSQFPRHHLSANSLKFNSTPPNFARIIHKITRFFNWIKELLFPVPFSKHRSFSSFYLHPFPFQPKRTNQGKFHGPPCTWDSIQNPLVCICSMVWGVHSNHMAPPVRVHTPTVAPTEVLPSFITCTHHRWPCDNVYSRAKVLYREFFPPKSVGYHGDLREFLDLEHLQSKENECMGSDVPMFLFG